MSKMGHHSHDYRKEAAVTWTPPLGCLSTLMSRQLISPRASDSKQSKEEALVCFMT